MKAQLFALPALVLTSLLSVSTAFAQTWKIDPSASVLTWTGKKITGSSHTGTIAVKTGALNVEKGEIKGGTVVLDMNSINDTDLAGSPTDKAKLEGHLKSADFFDVQKYPEATYDIQSVKKVKGDEHTVSGTLTLKGKKAPLSFPATISIAGDTATAKGKLKFDRTTWDVRYGSGKFFKGLGDKMIADEIEMELNLTAKK